MKRRTVILLSVAGVLVLGAAGTFIAYKAGAFRSVDTERGDLARGNEASGEVFQAPPPSPAANWPNFRYDERRTGINPRARARPPFVRRWVRGSFGQIEVPPAIFDGTMVWASYDGKSKSYIVGINAKTSKLLWKRQYPHRALFAASPAVHKGLAYVPGFDGKLRVLNVRTGSVIWTFRAGEMESSPIVSGGLVYFGSNDGKARAVNIKTHKLVWEVDTGGKVASGPALTDTTAYFGSYGGSVFAVNKRTGKLRWRTEVTGRTGRGVPFYSTPALGDGRVFIGGNDGSVYSLDARTGAQKWRFDGGGYAYGSPTLSKGTVYIGDFGGGFRALRAKNGKPRWTQDGRGPILGSALVVGDVVYTATMNTKTYGFDTRTGREVFKLNDGRFSAGIADGDDLWLMGRRRLFRFTSKRVVEREFPPGRDGQRW